jgi:tetratricopeptide (TPR) repeat protein
MSEWKLRILHISDLHERGPREREPFRRRHVLGEAWERNLHELQEDGAIDLVCFTGDVADWGRPEEYASTTPFIESLLQRLSLPVERLFLVPGNHDIDRSKGQKAWSALRGKRGRLPSIDPLALSRWMAGGAPPPGLEKVRREELLSRQAAYREWVGATLGREELLPESSPHRFLGYRQTLRLPGRPFDLHVVGLDSAWLAGDDHDSGKLLLTEDQVWRLTTDDGGAPLHGFRLALVHHPLTELADGSACSRRLAEQTDLLLRGHLHDVEVGAWSDPDRSSRQLAAGCLYEGHHANPWPNACHVIEISLDEAGRPLRHELRFRAWSSRGHWHDDDSRYRETKAGRLTWHLQPRPLPRPAPSTRLFVGRTRELDALKAAVIPADRRPVAICALHGMPGVGKSYLAERFAEVHKAHFPGGWTRLVLNPNALPGAEALLGELGDQLKLPAGGHTAERCRERLLRPLSLVIVENVDSREAAAVVGQLVTWLSGCPLLVTGRFEGFWQHAGWERVEVEEFDEATALQLLEKEFRPSTDEREREQHRALVKALGGLPLALHLAAGHLRAGHSVDSFLALLRSQDFELEPVDPSDPLLMKDRARALIRSTFELSLKLMRAQLGARAERLSAGLAALGHAPLSGFGRSLGAAIAGVSELEFGELVACATTLSLLTRVSREERRTDAWRVHPLLAELLRGQPGAAEGLGRMTRWFLDRLPELPMEQEQFQGERWKEIQQEITALVDWLQLVPHELHEEIRRAGATFATSVGPFPAWMAYCERVLRIALSPEARSGFLWMLASVGLQCGELDRALAAAREKGALDQSRQDEHGEALAASLRADVLRARGELDEALRLRREEVLPRFERLGATRERALALGEIADILQARGGLDEALRIRREEVLPAFERLGSPREQAVARGEIADILQARGELDEALRIWKQEVLPVFERLGAVRERAVALGKIAGILQVRGKLDEALRIRKEEVLPAFERLGAVREQAEALGEIADILEARGELDEALRIWRKEVLPVFQSLGAVRERAVALGKVASILESHGAPTEALQIWQREVLPVFQRLGATRERAVAMGQVANILEALNAGNEAMELRVEVLSIFERLGNVQDMLVGRARLAQLYLARRKPGDRDLAANLLHAARQLAESRGLPEATEIQKIQRKHRLLPPLRPRRLSAE